MTYKDYPLGDFLLRYLIDPASGHVSMVLLPANLESCYEERRETLGKPPNVCSAWSVGSLCHLSLSHHPQSPGAGGTLKYGYSTEALRYVKQEKQENENKLSITTILKAEEGYWIEHTVEYTPGESGVEVSTRFLNQSGRTLRLDLLTSFSLDNLSPFQRDDAPEKIKLHRFRGGWSLEGKHTEDTVEDLNLELSWYRCFPESERYGVLGSHPVKRWFPFGCVEDMEHHIFWSAQVASNSSWQMEFTRDGDCFSLSGGLADREFGGWSKEIPDGGSFLAPKAFLSVSADGLWDACQNLTGMFQKYADLQPEPEGKLPILFNEWCTTWGSPSHSEITALAHKLQPLGISYLVIDAGWSKKPVESSDPQAGNGDWEIDPDKFPEGFRPLSLELESLGMSLGIWMEFEVTTKGAYVHGSPFDSLHLTRNGTLIQTGNIRRFWDFRRPEVMEYLKEKVIEFLRSQKIRYLKVDYNGSIGAGCDGAESPGEGLRAQMEAVLTFFRLIRRELPDLVIENCASGGHRLEPSMVTLTAMSSFSDAHECSEIPYIAANLHPLILPRQSQIWAVISKELSLREVQYRLTSAMLGRFCLSGNILELEDKQWEAVKQAAEFYRQAKDIIKCGRSLLFRNSTNNQHHLRGAQALTRQSGDEILLVYHSFDQPPESLQGLLPVGTWTVKSRFGADCRIKLHPEGFVIYPRQAFEGSAFLLSRI